MVVPSEAAPNYYLEVRQGGGTYIHTYRHYYTTLYLYHQLLTIAILAATFVVVFLEILAV